MGLSLWVSTLYHGPPFVCVLVKLTLCIIIDFTCLECNGTIIVGNKMLLKYDDTWKELIQHYEERGCEKVGRQFPCSRDLRDLVRRKAQ